MNNMSDIAAMLPGARGKGGGEQRQAPRLESPATSTCTACGKGGEALKKCNACKSVEYCSRQCQSSDWRAHKTRCEHLKERKADLLEDMMAKQLPPPPPEDCPICFIPMPWNVEEKQHMPCCGKIICAGCTIQMRENRGCPFCREPPPTEVTYFEQIKERMRLKDSEAFVTMGSMHLHGMEGQQLDKTRGMNLYFRAAALGSIPAHTLLGYEYMTGETLKKDVKKARQHFQIAALSGETWAWTKLGEIEAKGGNDERALMHWMAAAMGGDEFALTNIKLGYTRGLVTKEGFETALRAHKDSVDAMRSEPRDRAAAIERDPGNRSMFLRGFYD